MIELPDGVKKFKLRGEEPNVNITEVKIPDSVTCISVSSDRSIKKIKLPAGVEYYYEFSTYVDEGGEKSGQIKFECFFS